MVSTNRWLLISIHIHLFFTHEFVDNFIYCRTNIHVPEFLSPSINTYAFFWYEFISSMNSCRSFIYNWHHHDGQDQQLWCVAQWVVARAGRNNADPSQRRRRSISSPAAQPSAFGRSRSGSFRTRHRWQMTAAEQRRAWLTAGHYQYQ